MRPSPAKTPLTVIGGFLGAGKTTFLNHLLKTGRSRTAILVNDFGAVNIDAGLIARHDGATMTLTNGCVCCSIGGGFIETLGKLLDDGIPFDHIVIEASGVGDPWRIAEIGLVEPALRLHAVIVLADASRIEALLTDIRVGDTVRNQFERCDVVLLNKADLVDKSAMQAAHAAIGALRKGLRIVETSAQTMPDLSGLSGKAVSVFRADAPLSAAVNHEQTFRRWSYQRSGSFDRTRLAQALLDLPPQLLRLKGACRVAGEDGLFVLQMVERASSLTPSCDSDVPAGPDILLVGIGTFDLPEPACLDRILDSALVASTSISTGPQSIAATGGTQDQDSHIRPFKEERTHVAEEHHS
jgi:G3E family GTPase